MEDGKPSFTAAAVAFARALGGVDPLAAQLLSRRGTIVAGALARHVMPALGGVGGAVVDLGLGGIVSHLRLRTLAIDAAVAAAVAGGVTDVVILGAGLDSRAFRLASLRAASVFEVDVPAMATRKQRALARLSLRHPAWTSVAVDFSRDDLGRCLAQCGQRADRPTLWIWEGVTMYLSPTATVATLDVITRRSGPGSQLIMSYMQPAGLHTTAAGGLVLRAFASIAEPLIGAMSAQDVSAAVAQRGWRVLSDEGQRDWSRAHGRSGWRAQAFAAERICVAQGPAAALATN